MNQQKLWCLSFLLFEQLCKENGWDNNVPDDIAIISIIGSDDCRDDNEIHICHGDNVLNLEFDDCDPVAFGLDVNIEEYTYKSNGKETTLKFFNNDMAKQAIDFIERNKNKHFYIHCSAGVSRSQAFVKYISEKYNNIDWITNPINPCEFPNGYVIWKLRHCQLPMN